MQNIRFRLDERGAILKSSEAACAAACYFVSAVEKIGWVKVA